MIDIEETLNLLGMEVQDKVTGFHGIVTSVNFDLYGCVKVLVHPGIDENQKLKEEAWFYFNRLTVLGTIPVMTQPDFDI